MGGLGKKSYPPARGFYPWQACGTFLSRRLSLLPEVPLGHFCVPLIDCVSFSAQPRFVEPLCDCLWMLLCATGWDVEFAPVTVVQLESSPMLVARECCCVPDPWL